MAISQPKSLYKNNTKKYKLVSQDSCLLALLTATSDIIIRLDENYKIVAFNKPAGRYYGWSPTKALGKNYQELCRDSGFRFFIPDKASQKWSSQTRIKTKSTIQHKNGSKHVASWTISSLLDSKKRLVGFLLVGKPSSDIADLKNTQAALKKEKIANRAKSNFLATISHELRTPLNGILGVVQILMKRPHLPEQYESLKDIYQSGSNLLALVNDILDFSKLEAGKLDFSFEVFNFKDLAEDVIAKMAYQLDGKEVKLLLDYSNKAPNFVIGDELRIRQILVNLIGNAIKFTEKGHIKIFVKCKSTKGEKANFSIIIQDTGIGIPQDKLEKIFERFSQVDSQYSRKYGGAGLGLAICYQLINAMGGRIGARSALGKGSEFWVQLSFSLPKNSTLANRLLHHNQLIQQEQLVKISGHVLLVEDNLLNQKIAKVMLEELGCNVDLASTGMEAIRQLQMNDYELVFMDISLPDMDGITVTQKLRSEKYKDLPIIALTAHALEEEKEKFLAAGMNDVVVKPINQAQLSDILMKYLAHK